MENINFKNIDKNAQKEITALFASVFTESEGESEGQLIRNLVLKLSSNIDNQEIICLSAYQEELIIGSIFLTRLKVNKPIDIYMLAPVAVSTEYQGKGIGQALINYGLKELKNRDIAVAITYGDPSFYSKVGFESLSEEIIKAPLKMSMPEGWLGQSLTEKNIPFIGERPSCVKEFNDPVYW